MALKKKQHHFWWNPGSFGDGRQAMAKESITKCIQSLLLAFLILASFHKWKPQAEHLKQLLDVSDNLTHGHIKKKTIFMVSRRMKNCLSLTSQFCEGSWICLPCLLLSIGSSIPCQPACLPRAPQQNFTLSVNWNMQCSTTRSFATPRQTLFWGGTYGTSECLLALVFPSSQVNSWAWALG